MRRKKERNGTEQGKNPAIFLFYNSIGNEITPQSCRFFVGLHQGNNINNGSPEGRMRGSVTK